MKFGTSLDINKTTSFPFHDSSMPLFMKSFSGHESFPFRFAWLKKGVDNLISDPDIFHRDDAIVSLGVGKNMVRSIRHWCLATRMIEENKRNKSRQLKPSKLGFRLLSDDGWDPYLEDNATLWLIHWNLASRNTRAATWYWAFNKYNEYTFSRASLLAAISRSLAILGWNDVALSSLKRDIDCLVNTYLPRIVNKVHNFDSIECPLTSLELIIKEPELDRYRFRVGPKATLPPAIFIYSLSEFWKNLNHTKKSLELRELMNNEGSPVNVYKLDEESVLNYLDKLADFTNGKLVFEDTALVRSVINLGHFPIDSMRFLEKYYES